MKTGEQIAIEKLKKELEESRNNPLAEMFLRPIRRQVKGDRFKEYSITFKVMAREILTGIEIVSITTKEKL